MTIWKARIKWVDGGGDYSNTQLTINDNGDTLAVVNYVSTFISIVSGVVQAHAVKYDLYRSVTVNGNAPADPTSNVRQSVLIFLGNKVSYDAVAIPSPVSSLFEPTGVYRQVRVRKGNADLISYVSFLASETGNILFETDVPINPVFMNGGLMY